MSSAFQRIQKVAVGPGLPPNLSGIDQLVSKSAYEAVTGLAGLAPDVVQVLSNQSSGSGVAYQLVVGDTEAGSYYGVTGAPSSASVSYLDSAGSLTVSGKDVVTLDTSSVSGYVSAAKNLNTAGELSLGVYGGADLAKIVKSGAFASANTYTLPDITGSFILSAGTQSIGGVKTFTGTVNVPAPSSGSEAANKSYVDSVATGLDFKQSVRLATTANLALSGSTPLVIDDITVANNDRLLLIAQTTGSQNGIYVATVTGGTYTLNRSDDADTSAKVTSGMYSYVEEGTVNGGFAFVLATANPIVLGTTSLSFVVFNQSYNYFAGNGLTLTGSTFAVASTITTDSFVANTSVQTPSIQPATVGGTIAFNSADISGVDELSAASALIPILNATGTTTLGNVSSAMSIAGSSVGVSGNTTITGWAKVASDSSQLRLGTDATNFLTVSANTSGFSAPKTYTVPITANSTANFAVIEGSAPASSEYILKATGTGHLATWIASSPEESFVATTTTTALTAVDLATLSTLTDNYYVAKVSVVAKRAGGEVAAYEFILPVKNDSDVLTIGSFLLNSASYDASFSGDEITFASTGASLRVVVTPTATTSTVWKARVAYQYVV